MALLTLSGPSWATYSIVATHTVTEQVGGAGTSCLGGGDVYRIYGSAPGYGAVQSQAQSSSAGRDESVQLLGEGASPDEIIAFITAPNFDPGAANRQYGVVDLQGRARGFTGGATLFFAADMQGSIGSFTYSVQGNILTSGLVLDHAAMAFESGGCDLAERLLLALEAGGSDGEGDSRCTDSGIPSDSAFLQVDRPLEPAGSYLELRVPSSDNENPLPLLRSQFEEWRITHPCPVELDAGASGGSGGVALVDAGSAGNPAMDGSVSNAAGGTAGGSSESMGGRDAGNGGTPPLMPSAEPPAAGSSSVSEVTAPSAPILPPTEAAPSNAAVAPPVSTMAPLLAADPMPTTQPSAAPSASTAPSGAGQDDGCKCALRSTPPSLLTLSSLLVGLLLFARRSPRR